MLLMQVGTGLSQPPSHGSFTCFVSSKIFRVEEVEEVEEGGGQAEENNTRKKQQNRGRPAGNTPSA